MLNEGAPVRPYWRELVSAAAAAAAVAPPSVVAAAVAVELAHGFGAVHCWQQAMCTVLAAGWFLLSKMTFVSHGDAVFYCARSVRAVCEEFCW